MSRIRENEGSRGDPVDQVPVEEDLPPAKEEGSETTSVTRVTHGEEKVSTFTHMMRMVIRPDCEDELEKIKALDETAAAIVAFMMEGKPKDNDNLKGFMSTKAYILWVREEIFQFLVSTLQYCKRIRNEITIKPVLLKVFWILENLIVYSSNPEDVVQMEKNDLFLLLTYFLMPPNAEVSEQAICIIAHLSQIPRYRLSRQFYTYAYHIVHALQFLFSPDKEKERSGDGKFVKAVVRIVTGILLTQPLLEDVLKEKWDDYRNDLLNGNYPGVMASIGMVVDAVRSCPQAGYKNHLPNTLIIQLCLALINGLLQLEENQAVVCEALCCVSVYIGIFEKNKDVARAGIYPKIVSILSCSDDEVVVSLVAMMIGQLAGDQDRLRSFLKALRESDELESYWRVLKWLEAENANQELKKNVISFLGGMRDLITNGNEESVNLVLESGIISTLPYCLDKKLPPEVQSHGIILIGQVLTNLEPEIRREVLNGGKFGVNRFLEVLSGSVGKEYPVGLQILAYLVESSPSRRDEAVSLGVIPSLLKALKQRTSAKDNEPVACIFNVIRNIMEVKPKAPLEAFQDVPAAIQRYWKNMPFSMERKEERIAVATHILAVIAGYGLEGIELIFQQADLLPKVMANLSSRNEHFQDAAMETILQVCRGTQAHRLSLLKDGLLNKFASVLRSPNVATRKMAIECMYAFLMERVLNLEQKIFMRNNLWSHIQTEVTKDNPETRLVASWVNEGIRDMFLARNRNPSMQ